LLTERDLELRDGSIQVSADHCRHDCRWIRSSCRVSERPFSRGGHHDVRGVAAGPRVRVVRPTLARPGTDASTRPRARRPGADVVYFPRLSSPSRSTYADPSPRRAALEQSAPRMSPSLCLMRSNCAHSEPVAESIVASPPRLKRNSVHVRYPRLFSGAVARRSSSAVVSRASFTIHSASGGWPVACASASGSRRRV
jgi:hypothetical protein